MSALLGLLASVAGTPGFPLQPLTPADYDVIQFQRAVPGEDMALGGEFVANHKTYLRLDGRHVVLRSGGGRRTCLVSPAVAAAIVAGRAAFACGGMRLTIGSANGWRGDGVPASLTAAAGRRRGTMRGEWQGLD